MIQFFLLVILATPGTSFAQSSAAVDAVADAMADSILSTKAQLETIERAVQDGRLTYEDFLAEHHSLMQELSSCMGAAACELRALRNKSVKKMGAVFIDPWALMGSLPIVFSAYVGFCIVEAAGYYFLVPRSFASSLVESQFAKSAIFGFSMFTVGNISSLLAIAGFSYLVNRLKWQVKKKLNGKLNDLEIEERLGERLMERGVDIDVFQKRRFGQIDHEYQWPSDIPFIAPDERSLEYDYLELSRKRILAQIPAESADAKYLREKLIMDAPLKRRLIEIILKYELVKTGTSLSETQFSFCGSSYAL